MVLGTERRRVVLSILAMQSIGKDDEGETTTDVVVIEEQ